MSRKRGKKPKAPVEAVPDDILAEGSGPVGGGARAGAALGADAIATVEDVVTTADIATTEDVVTADDVVATADEPAQTEDSSHDPGTIRAADVTIPQPDDGAGETAPAELDALGLAVAGGGLDLSDAGSNDGDDRGDNDHNSSDDGDGGDDDGGNGDGGGDGDDVSDGSDDDPAIVFPTSAASMDATQLKHLVEALVFASDRPLTVQRLRQLTRVSEVRRLEQALAEIAEDYRERGLLLQQVSGGYQFRTRTQFSPWVQQLIAGRPVRLSRAQLETLAIIAYRQPITRPEIDDIRGVDSSATLKLLIDRMLIRVLGKREEVGRPILYGTTKEFLDFFSLGDLRELPTLREYSELTAESRKVISDRLGIDPNGASSDAAAFGNATGHPAGHVGPDGANRHGSNSNGSNSNGSNGHGTSGHGTSGHGANGRGANGHAANGHSANEHDENERGAYDHGSIAHGSNEHDVYEHSSSEHDVSEHAAGEHDANEHSSHEDGANEHSASEHDVSEHAAGEHDASEHAASEHSASEHAASEHAASEHDANEHSSHGRGSNVHGSNEHGANEHGANEHGSYGRGSSVRSANQHDDDEALDDDGATEVASAMDLADAAAPLLSGDDTTEPPAAIDAGDLGGDAGDVEAASASDAEPGAD